MADEALLEKVKKLRDPKILAAVSNLELKSRQVVEGVISGLHKSPYKGFSVEFAEHRKYVPGDEIRYLDWRVYAKTDRYVIKEFEEETELRTHFMLDASQSMLYAGSHGVTKLEVAPDPGGLAGPHAHQPRRWDWRDHLQRQSPRVHRTEGRLAALPLVAGRNCQDRAGKRYGYGAGVP